MKLGSNLSEDDLNTSRRQSSSDYVEGFEPGSNNDLNDPFAGFGSSSDSDPFANFGASSDNDPFANFGVNSSDSDPFAGFGDSGIQASGGIGGYSDNGWGATNNNGWGINNGQQNGIGLSPDKTEEYVDKFIEWLKKAGENFCDIFKETIESVKSRNSDDLGYLGRNLSITGAVTLGIGLVLWIIGEFALNQFLVNVNFQVLLAGTLVEAFGLVSLGVAAVDISSKEIYHENIDLGNLYVDKQANYIDEYEKNAEANNNANFMSESEFQFGNNGFESQNEDSTEEEEEDEFDKLFKELNSTNEEQEEEESVESKATPEVKTQSAKDTKNNLNEIVDNIRANQNLNRRTLYFTFKPMLELCTPDFADSNAIDESDEKFQVLEALAKKAIAQALSKDLDDPLISKVKLVEASESISAYTLKIKRLSKKINIETLAEEFQNYFKESVTDYSVTAMINVIGDYYVVSVSTGNHPIVTLGDVLRHKECEDYVLDEGNKLPLLVGVNEMGEVVMDDAKKFDSMMITGKPRSGKSWDLYSKLMMLMLYNLPEDIQFIIVDPKKSPLLSKMALLPHVCGLHDGTRILEIMDVLINEEQPRRQKILLDNDCDDIWALRKKGIKLPIIYIMIDEYVSLINQLGDQSKELNARLQVLITKLPSIGIRVMFVPHRATGVVDKMSRGMLQYTASIKGENADIIDTLDIAKWNKPLLNPGDMAVKTSTRPNAIFARSIAICTDDEKNKIFTEAVAKAYYKMGVELPNMRSLGFVCNRDDKHIKKVLSGDLIATQYDSNSIVNRLNKL